MKSAILLLSTILCSMGVYAQAITGTTSICVGSTGSLISDSTGGIWTSGASTIATIDSFTGNINGVAAGTAVVTYFNYFGSYATATVTVNPLPAAITGTATVCEGASTTFADVSAGGTWTSSNNFVAMIGGTTGTAVGISTDTATIMYTISTGCTRSIVITVNPLPMPITASTNYCVGATDSLYEFGGGTWSTSSTGIITLGATAGYITGVAAGTATITYTLPTGCSTTLDVTVNPAPNAGTISGYEFVCIDGTITCTSNACCGTWSSNNTVIATVGASSGIVSGISAGLTIISYNVANSCGTASAILGVQVLSPEDCSKLGVRKTEGQKTELLVSPNPARDGIFTIDLSSSENEQAEIVITNAVGEKVKEFNASTNQKADVNLAQPAGLYIISATTAHGVYSSKIMVD